MNQPTDNDDGLWEKPAWAKGEEFRSMWFHFFVGESKRAGDKFYEARSDINFVAYQ